MVPPFRAVAHSIPRGEFPKVAGLAEAVPLAVVLLAVVPLAVALAGAAPAEAA